MARREEVRRVKGVLSAVRGFDTLERLPGLPDAGMPFAVQKALSPREKTTWPRGTCMARLAPPPPPLLHVSQEDNDGRRRLQFHLWLVWMSLLTVLATAWCVTLGPVPAILALVVAKHVLVALLVMGLGVDAQSSPS
jgi:hypothetical protein